MSTLGERLRIARDKSGLKQTQVKDRTNINNKTLSGYENNVSQPDPETLVVLADLYEVRYEWLFAGKGEMSPNRTSSTKSTWHSTLPELTDKDERTVEKDLQSILENLGPGGAYSQYDGGTLDEADQEDREILEESIRNSMRLAKRIAKQKFTPKKYRD